MGSIAMRGGGVLTLLLIQAQLVLANVEVVVASVVVVD